MIYKTIERGTYQICNRCIMDTSDPEISFDKEGNCNHCTDALERAKTEWKPNAEGKKELESIIKKIKREEKDKSFDCVLGLSGGIDSSYMAYQAHKLGLRPLVVHVDCGWNSAQAVKNIENIVTKLGFDLHTHVVDWQEMKDLQLAYFKANVANQDVPQDHAIFAALYRFAVKNNVKYVLNGSNFATECILPTSWGYGATDLVNLKDIHRKFGTIRLKHFPRTSFFTRYIYFPIVRQMSIVKMLNLISYKKEEAIDVMKKDIDWQYYGGKHHESRFTKFFQAYYLPHKFGYDKRRAHLSSLIVSGQKNRQEALKEMEEEIYPNDSHLEDMEYVATKIGVSLDEFQQIINMPNRTYNDYENIAGWFDFGMKLRNFFRRK